jgi:phage gp36-like protein
MIDRYEERELIQLTDEHGTGSIDVATLDKALADADAKIDSYLTARYVLPLAVAPQALKLYACDIARFLLHDDMATEQVRKRYEDAIRFLEKVSEGKISLGIDSNQQQPPAVCGPQIDAPARVFSKDTLGDY